MLSAQSFYFNLELISCLKVCYRLCILLCKASRYALPSVVAIKKTIIIITTNNCRDSCVGGECFSLCVREGADYYDVC